MVFEKIKEHFKQKKGKEQMFFAIKLAEEDGVCYVVDKKTTEIMLVGDWSLQSLKNCDFVERKGWHIEDDKVFERYCLNDKGEWLYDYMEVKHYKDAYWRALYEMNNNISSKHLKLEKMRIENFFKIYGIESISLYKEKVLTPKEQEQEKVVKKVEEISKNEAKPLKAVEQDPIDYQFNK